MNRVVKKCGLCVVAVAAILLSAKANTNAVNNAVLTAKMAELAAKNGGLVNPPADIKRLVILDGRVNDLSQLTNHLSVVCTRLGIAAEIKRFVCGETTDVYRAAVAEKRKDAGAVVVLYERKDTPVMTAYPEEGVTLLNVLPLQGVDYTPYRWRLVKEFWRSIAFALGAYGSFVPTPTCMQPVYGLDDLDALKTWSLTPQQITAVSACKAKLKLYNPRPVPYSRACREGWAPQPTNAVQRALYDRLLDPTARFKADAPVPVSPSVK